MGAAVSVVVIIIIVIIFIMAAVKMGYTAADIWNALKTFFGMSIIAMKSGKGTGDILLMLF